MHLTYKPLFSCKTSPRMPGKGGEWCDSLRPCHGPFSLCPFDDGERAPFLALPSLPPAPAFECQEGTEDRTSPMNRYRQVVRTETKSNMTGLTKP